jgi:hypothetical protein
MDTLRIKLYRVSLKVSEKQTITLSFDLFLDNKIILTLN